MKTNRIQIMMQIFLIILIFSTIYMNIFWSFKPNDAFAEVTHNLEMEWLECYDEFGNHLGTGFHCTWSGDDCWYYGSSCPPDWKLN